MIDICATYKMSMPKNGFDKAKDEEVTSLQRMPFPAEVMNTGIVTNT